MSKYASNTAVLGELGRFPVINTARSLLIKYWLRLNAGTDNILLNEAYNTCKQENLQWIQCVQHLLYENGFGDVWESPNSVNKNTFHKYFRQRLQDQYVQNWNTKINESSRFTLLQFIHKDYKLQDYIVNIKNPNVREIFTRLRIDMNILCTSKIHGSQNVTNCFLCHNGNETVDHFLLKCAKFNDIRTENFEKFQRIDSNFINLDDNEKIMYILSTECPEKCLVVCCNFVTDMYKQRESENSLRPA